MLTESPDHYNLINSFTGLLATFPGKYPEHACFKRLMMGFGSSQELQPTPFLLMAWLLVLPGHQQVRLDVLHSVFNFHASKELKKAQQVNPSRDDTGMFLDDYCQTSNIGVTLAIKLLITQIIFDLTPGFNRLHKDNCKMRQETFEFWDLVWLILEIWQWVNTMAADVLAPCVARTSAVMVLTMKDKWVLPFHEGGLQLLYQPNFDKFPW